MGMFGMQIEDWILVAIFVAGVYAILTSWDLNQLKVIALVVLIPLYCFGWYGMKVWMKSEEVQIG